MKGDFVFAVPGDLDDADRRLRLRPAHDRGIARARLAAGGARTSATAFRRPNALTLRGRAGAALPTCRKAAPIVIDGLAFGVLPEAAEALRETHPLIALVHHPLALETGVTPQDAATLARERARGARLHARASSSPARRPRAARGGLRRAARSASPSRRPAPIAPQSCGEAATALGRAACGRRGRAAQGLRRADRGARRARSICRGG